jgi:hypothetical protein
MSELNPNATQGEQGAENLQNAGMLAEIEFIKILAQLLTNIANRDIPMEDITIKYGANKTIWPSNKPDLEIIAKIKEAMTDPESKASFRILIQNDQGTTEKLYHQTAGKVVYDPYKVKPLLQDILVQNVLQPQQLEAEPQVQAEVEQLTPNNQRLQLSQELPENFGLQIAAGLIPEIVQQMGDSTLSTAYDKTEYARMQLNSLNSRAKQPEMSYLLETDQYKFYQKDYVQGRQSVENRLNKLAQRGKYTPGTQQSAPEQTSLQETQVEPDIGRSHTVRERSTPDLNCQEYMRLVSNVTIPEHLGHLKEFVSTRENLESMAQSYPERSRELDWVVARQARTEGVGEIGIAAVISASPYTAHMRNVDENEAQAHVQGILTWAYSDRMNQVYDHQGVDRVSVQPSTIVQETPSQSARSLSRDENVAALKEQLVVTQQQIQSLEKQVKYLSQVITEMSSNPTMHNWIKEAQMSFEKKSESLRDGLKNKFVIAADKVAGKVIGVADRIKDRYQQWYYNTPLLMERAIDSLMKSEYGAEWTDQGARFNLGEYTAVNDVEKRSRYIEDNKTGQVIWRDCIQAQNLAPQQAQFLLGFNRKAEIYVAKANERLQQQQQAHQQQSKPQQQAKALARAG